MIVSLAPGADPESVRRRLADRGLWTRAYRAGDGTAQLLVLPHSGRVAPEALLAIDGVTGVSAPAASHPLVAAQPATLEIGRTRIGAGAPPVMMAGPCAVESRQAIDELAALLARLGVSFLRGGAFKPRSSPYDFQGRGAQALEWLREAADAHGLLVVTEALSEQSAAAVAEHADLVQIGSRNMHNTALLQAVGRTGRPVLLKRGMAALVDEWLSAAEYLLLHGASGVVFCERGIRSFDGTTRNLLDLGAVALLAHVHHLPVIVDPSHALGRRDLIPPLSRAALAAGAAGLLLEVHQQPGESLSDGPQALAPREIEEVLAGLGQAGTVGKAR
jgi:3-deoxy-7-phosphoheptulonate synthase